MNSDVKPKEMITMSEAELMTVLRSATPNLEDKSDPYFFKLDRVSLTFFQFMQELKFEIKVVKTSNNEIIVGTYFNEGSTVSEKALSRFGINDIVLDIHNHPKIPDASLTYPSISDLLVARNDRDYGIVSSDGITIFRLKSEYIEWDDLWDFCIRKGYLKEEQSPEEWVRGLSKGRKTRLSNEFFVESKELIEYMEVPWSDAEEIKNQLAPFLI
ncbi:MAG: hypothetical protein ACMG57_02180 [Candidatus Dojkabacteria bacterium]